MERPKIGSVWRCDQYEGHRIIQVIEKDPTKKVEIMYGYDIYCKPYLLIGETSDYFSMCLENFEYATPLHGYNTPLYKVINEKRK